MSRRSSPTMQNIAEAAGVSVATVSRIFNNGDFARSETRNRVIHIASQIGYSKFRRRDESQPGEGVHHRALRSAERETVVLMAPESILYSPELPMSSWIFRDIVPAIQRISRQRGFHLVLSSYGEGEQWDEKYLTAEHISGIIWLAPGGDALLHRLAKLVPLVVINDDSIFPPRTCVVPNNRLVIFKGIEHLAELGHRRIAYFDVDDDSDVHSRERAAAYRESLAYFKLDIDPALCVRERFGMNEHPQAVTRAMDRLEALKTPATALIGPLGYSIQFLKEMRKRSIRVPEDFSIVAVDNAPAAEAVDPPLTTIDCGYARCAELAVQLLLEQKPSAEKSANTIEMEPTLIVRNSTARLIQPA